MSLELPRVDVVGVGLNAADTILVLPHFPEFNSKVELLSSSLLLGGQVATAMVACQRWGLSTRYVGKVGADAAAELHDAAFTEAGVEAHLLREPHCPSQRAFILVDARSGERTILWQRDPRLELRPEEINPEWVRRASLLHVDGHNTAAAAAAARWAREAGIPVTADLDNLYPGVEHLLPHVDYVLASREFPERLLGEPDLRRSLPEIQRRYGCKVAAATLGRQGVLAWDGERFCYRSGFVVDAVDTTGAGDVFHAGFIYGLKGALKGTSRGAWGLEVILDFACAAAALNCTAPGARGGIRPVAEIEALMRSGRRHQPEASFEDLAHPSKS